MNAFFSKEPSEAKNQIVSALYDRLAKSRGLVAIYSDVVTDNNPDSDWDRGYRDGIKEEVQFLENLLDSIEKA